MRTKKKWRGGGIHPPMAIRVKIGATCLTIIKNIWQIEPKLRKRFQDDPCGYLYSDWELPKSDTLSWQILEQNMR